MYWLKYFQFPKITQREKQIIPNIEMDLYAAVTNLPSKKETNVMEEQNKIKPETISTITEPK